MTEGQTTKFDVFLSHSHVDAEVIEQIAARLTDEAQLHVWLDKWEMVPGNLFRQGLAKGLDEAASCAVFLSNSTPRGWFDQEVGRALDKQASEANFRVIPVILPDGDRSVVTDFLKLRTWVEFKGSIADPSAWHLLVCGIKGISPGRGPTQTKQPAKQFFSVPVQENPFFTGREEALKRVEQNLAVAGTAALSGMGGMGKSQIAAQYAYTHRGEYGAVLWANADTSETLTSALAGIAGVLGLPESEAREQDAAVKASLKWLDSNDGWLLILDNANDLPVIHDLVPRARANKHHIVVTTQAQAVGTLRRVPLDAMPLADGTTLLLRRAKLIEGDAVSEALDPKQRKCAEDIVKELDGLPLAIDQAGAYIEETGCGLQGYLDLYKKHSADLLEERGATAGEHDSVARTFALSFARVEKANPGAAELLRLCAFLQPDAIPEEILTEGAAELGPVLQLVAADAFELNKSIGETLKFSLLERDADNHTLNIHRLVQVVIKDGMDEVRLREWGERAINAVKAAFPYIEFANWPACERLVPHAQACASLIEELSFESEGASRLLNQTGYYLDERARYAEAEPLYRSALAIGEKVLGPDAPDVATALNNLGELYRKGGDYAQAEPLYRRAIAIREKTQGSGHTTLAVNLNNLAELYREQGEYAEAEPLYQRALAIHEKALGPDDPAVATNLNNLAALYYDQGKYAEAEPLYQRAFAIDEKTLESDHPSLAVDLNNLANLCSSQGKYAESEPLFQRSLAILENALGPEHPNVASVLENLADLYRSQNRDAEAEPLEARAKAIREKKR
jgi:tetratricopeptide (TPR) repeat protein